MPSVDESIKELQSVRGSIEDGRNQISSASEELERHQSAIGTASQTLEDVAASTDSAAGNLEQLLSDTLALTYRSNAEVVQAAKERVLQAAVQLRAAKDQVAQAAKEVISVRDSLAESVGILTQSDTAVEEAINRLSSLPLPTGTGPSGAEFAAAASHQQPPPRLPKGYQDLKKPNNRHLLDRIAPGSHVNEANTVILPHVDFEADFNAITQGRAPWNPSTNSFHINGRRYGIETKTNTLYPIAGEGLVPMPRQSYKALKGVIASDGDRSRLPRRLTSNPHITKDDWDRAFEVFGHLQRHRDSTDRADEGG